MKEVHLFWQRSLSFSLFWAAANSFGGRFLRGHVRRQLLQMQATRNANVPSDALCRGKTLSIVPLIDPNSGLPTHRKNVQVGSLLKSKLNIKYAAGNGPLYSAAAVICD